MLDLQAHARSPHESSGVVLVQWIGEVLENFAQMCRSDRYAQSFPNRAVHTIELFRKQPDGQKSSMLVDLKAGKPIELPWLSGRVHVFGRELGIKTPANSAVWAALSPYADGRPRIQPL